MEDKASMVKPGQLGLGADRGTDAQADFREHVVSAAAWSMVCLWGNRVLTLLFFIVLARLLPPEAFGLVALSMVYVGLLGILQEQGFAQAVIQREQLHPDHLNTAFWMNVVFGLVLVVVTLLGASLVGVVFHEPRLPGVVRALSPLLLISALTCVQRALLHRQLDFRALAMASVGGVLVGGVVGTLAAVNGLGVWALVLHQLISRACESLIMWWQSDWRPSLRWTTKHFWDLFRFGKYVIASQGASFLHTYAADMIIGLFLGTAAVGLFDVAYRCVRMVTQMISGVVTKVSFPAFARLQQEPGRGRVAFLKATSQVALLSFPVFVGMAVLAPDIIAAVFGEKWIKTAPAMRALCFVGVLQSVYYLKRSLVLAYGKASWHFGLELIAVVLTVTALLASVHWGISAAAWAHVVATAICYPIVFLAVRRLVSVRTSEYVRSLVPALVGSGAMAAAILFAKSLISAFASPALMLTITLPTGVLVFVATIWIVDPAALARSFRYIQAMYGKVLCYKS